MYIYKDKDEKMHRDDTMNRKPKQADTTVPLGTEHYYPSRDDVIQRYLIIGKNDATSLYHKRKRESPLTVEQELDQYVTQIAIEMLKELESKRASAAAEDECDYLDHLIETIRKDQDNLLRKQIKKWIKDEVGNKWVSKNKTFGQKYQPRVYRTYYDLAVALVGWVEAKNGRREEKQIAKDILQDKAISYHLDSVFLRINHFISNDRLKNVLENEIRTGQKITVNFKGEPLPKPADWTIYQSYYSDSASTQNQLPNHWEVLMHPDQHNVRQKTGVLHDLMHYFWEKFGDDELFRGFPRFMATTFAGRKQYSRPKNSQIRGNMAEAKKGIRPLNLARDVEYSTEEQDDSYRYARRYGLPMYGRHSFSAARMMALAKQTGSSDSEITAVGWAIMAYWRIHYDHTSIPYHTTHEIMDFTPEFGIHYDPLNRFASLKSIQNDGFLNFLMLNAATDPRALGALMNYHSSDLERSKYLLAHSHLWKLQEIMRFLQKTMLPLEEFLQLSPDHLYTFFNYNDENRRILSQLEYQRQAHVNRWETAAEND